MDVYGTWTMDIYVLSISEVNFIVGCSARWRRNKFTFAILSPGEFLVWNGWKLEWTDCRLQNDVSAGRSVDIFPFNFQSNSCRFQSFEFL